VIMCKTGTACNVGVLVGDPKKGGLGGEGYKRKLDLCSGRNTRPKGVSKDAVGGAGTKEKRETS